MRRLLLLLALCAPLAARADLAASGEAIAKALNARDSEAMVRMLDVDSIVALVVKDLGLSETDRNAVRRGLPTGLRNNISMSMRAMEQSRGTAKYLRTGKRDGKSFALVRYEMGEQGIDYVEYYLTPGLKVQDWYIHSAANLYSASARFDLATMLKTDSMLFGLFGSRLVTPADIKPFTDLRDQLQAGEFAKAYRTLEGFPEGYRKSRHWALMRVTYGGRIDEPTHRASLRHLAQNFGSDPELQFMLIDHYFFEQQFERALGAIGGLERTVGGEDAATANLRGNVLAAMKRYEQAAAACRHGMKLEPDHKPAYWCLIGIGVAAKNGKYAVEGLAAYESAFAVDFDPQKLSAMPEYREVVRTPEFAAWARKKR
jgi:hypothetical protein